MYIANVVGTVVSTRKNDHLVGTKILIVQPLNVKLQPEGPCEIAVDSVGAGVGETVLISTGSSASKVFDAANSPIDRAIVGIVDSVEVSG
ncbi:MAG TPA: EutN/CcmL family microcompartment protein [Anaerovoracaceae bacterium]|nr:EutN/CcmL family microcompartment protein [Anaerovoracaceae bacterium]